MTELQRVIKYLAIAFAIVLAVSIVFGMIGAIGMIFGLGRDDMLLEESVNINISQSITALKIDVEAAELSIVEGDSFSLSSNIKDLHVNEKNGELSIVHKHKNGIKIGIHSTKVGEIVLTVPCGISFEKVVIDAGAGDINISALVANKVSFDFGAGKVSIDHIEVTDWADIDTGAGMLSIGDGSIKNLDLDLGVGKTVLKASLVGRSDIDCGVGATELKLLGNREDYTLIVNSGIGSISIDGDYANGNSTFGNGANVVNIDGGVGSIDITFEND
jgi:hypothetical protein